MATSSQRGFVDRRKKCERCNNGRAEQGERFCLYCRTVILAEMRRTGYLTRSEPSFAKKAIAECLAVDERLATIADERFKSGAVIVHVVIR